MRRLRWERDRARFGAQRVIRRAARAVGLEAVTEAVYSPIPAVPPPESEIWRQEYPLEVDAARQMAFIESELAPYLRELPAGLAPAERHGFTLWNGQYQAGDAELLYAMIRHLRPRRVLELGSGFSTLISAAACVANARDGRPTELVAVDPKPRARIGNEIAGLAQIESRDCRDLSLERYLELDVNDVLFVDTSHVVKLGSEVNWLVLEVLPRLKSGVRVHFHDVFLPYEYPRYLFEADAYFNEQYLLQAMLTGSDDWDVTLALCAIYRRHRERLDALVPSLRADARDPRLRDVSPAAFWLRRK